MANAKEVREGTAPPICSVTLQRCHCGSTGRCESRRGCVGVDNATTQTVLLIRTAGVYLETVIDTLTEAGDTLKQSRPYPAPEIREVINQLCEARAYINRLAKGK